MWQFFAWQIVRTLCRLRSAHTDQIERGNINYVPIPYGGYNSINKSNKLTIFFIIIIIINHLICGNVSIRKLELCSCVCLYIRAELQIHPPLLCSIDAHTPCERQWMRNYSNWILEVGEGYRRRGPHSSGECAGGGSDTSLTRISTIQIWPTLCYQLTRLMQRFIRVSEQVAHTSTALRVWYM